MQFPTHWASGTFVVGGDPILQMTLRLKRLFQLGSCPGQELELRLPGPWPPASFHDATLLLVFQLAALGSDFYGPHFLFSFWRLRETLVFPLTWEP